MVLKDEMRPRLPPRRLVSSGIAACISLLHVHVQLSGSRRCSAFAGTAASGKFSPNLGHKR